MSSASAVHALRRPITAHSLSAALFLLMFPFAIATQALYRTGHPDTSHVLELVSVSCLLAAGVAAFRIPEKDAWMRVLGRASAAGLVVACLFIFYLDLRQVLPLP